MNNDMRSIFGQRQGWAIVAGPGDTLERTWKAAQCIRCGAQVFRRKRDEDETHWELSFEEGMQTHEAIECPHKTQ